MQMSIKSNFNRIAAQVPREFRFVVPRAGAIALNRANRAAMTATYRGLAREMGLPQKKLKARGTLRRIVKAYAGRLKAGFSVRGKPLNVIHWNAKQFKAGVKHGAWQGGRRRKLARGTFIMPTGGKQAGAQGTFVAKRVGGKKSAGPGKVRAGRSSKSKVTPKGGWERLRAYPRKRKRPIKGVYGPWAPREFLGKHGGPDAGRGISQEAQARAEQQFPKEFVRALDRLIGKATGRL